jgi:hypothetical protein
MSGKRAKQFRAIATHIVANDAQKRNQLTEEHLPFHARNAAKLIKKLKHEWRDGDMRQRHCHEKDAQSGRHVDHLPHSAAHVVVQAQARLARNDYTSGIAGSRKLRSKLATKMRTRDEALVAAHS